jgi:hypothetical protein
LVNHESAGFLVRVYYALSFWAMAYILLYGLEVSKNKYFDRFLTYLPLVCVVATIICLFSDAFISGSLVVHKTLLSVQGPWYWVFQLSVFVSMLSVITLLLIGSVRSSEYAVRTQCAYTLLAMAPLTLVGPAIVILQMMGAVVNTVMLLPIASTLYLLMIFIGEARHGLTDLRMYLPNSVERRTSSKLLRTSARFSNREVSFKEAQELVERTLIIHALEKSKYNVSHAAKHMQISRSTLYSACKRLGVDLSYGSERN